MPQETRSSKWLNSLAFRYLGIATTFLVLVQFIVGLVEIRQNYVRQLQDLEQKVTNEALFLSAVSPEAVLSSDFLTLERLVKQTTIEPDIIYSVIFDKKGQALTRFVDLNKLMIFEENSTLILQIENSSEFISQLRKNQAIREIKVPIKTANSLILGEVHLVYSLNNVYQEIYHSTLLKLVQSLVISLLLASLTIILFYKQVRQPLQEVVVLSQALAKGDLNQRAMIDHLDEIGQLKMAFNAMADKLQGTLGKLSRSHQVLENKVKERTAQIQETNDSLVEEIRERYFIESELKTTLKKLKETQLQLIQQEKMSALGELVAGIAHEINNPVNFIHGNLHHAKNYTYDLLKLVELYQQHSQVTIPGIEEHVEEIELEFLQHDFPKILKSMEIGTDRIREIVLSLRNFSRLDESSFKSVDIHEGLESTLMILNSRLKDQSKHDKIQIIKQYGNIPLVECYPRPLNQVFMNIISNAIDALEEQGKHKDFAPEIRIKTASLDDDQQIKISIQDNGSGMTNAVQKQIFNPFFTTKAIGQGTGLGMSISYQIITEKHQGSLDCISSPGQGTEFVIQIPVKLSSYKT